MIFGMPRVVTGPLPEGQDWTIRQVGDASVIVVSEDLDEDGHKAARRAAYQTMRKRHLVWIPLPVVVAGGWLSRKAHTRLGTATLASLATAAAVYGAVVTLDGNSRPLPLAEPPVIVTIHPTAPTALPSRSASPDRTPPTGQPTAPTPAQTSGPPPTTGPDPTRTPAPTPTRTATPDPDPAEATPTANPSVSDAPTATQTPSASTPPPGPSPTTATSSPPTSSPPTSQPTAVACGGIHLRVPLNPLLDVDACVLG